MKRSAPLRRKTWMRRRNHERAARERVRAFGRSPDGGRDGPQAELARKLPCCACGRRSRPWDRTHAAHVRSRGARGGPEVIVPLCARCHDLQGRVGILTFQRLKRVDLFRVARELAEAIAAHDCDAWPVYRDGGMRAECAVCGRPSHPEAIAR